MADRSLIQSMARDMYLNDATRTIKARGGSAVPTPAWYDEYAAMPVTGPGFVAEWEGHARAALRSILDHGPTPAMVHAGAHAVIDTPGPSALVAKRAFRLMIAAELENGQ